MSLVDRVAQSVLAKTWDPTQGTSLGLFIRLPDGVAEQFPSLGEFDSSPPHITFTYVGDDTPEEREEEFIELCTQVFSTVPSVVKARLGPVDYFTHIEKGRRIAYSKVTFSYPLDQTRAKLLDLLSLAGFSVSDVSPLVYHPHVTLGYLDGLFATWAGPQPTGTFEISEIEVWGGSKAYKIPFGGMKKRGAAKHPGTTIPISVDLTRWSPDKDSKGRPVAPGDHVRFPTGIGRTKTMLEGRLELSDRKWTVLPGGIEVGSLVVVTDDGTAYNAVHKMTKVGVEEGVPSSWTKLAALNQKSIALMKFLSQVARDNGVGNHVYVVGGAVRNFVINQPIKDVDVVVDSVALHGKDSAWFAKKVEQAIPTEVHLVTNNYGVALLKVVGDWELGGVNLKGEDIEIANARKESYGGEGGAGYKPHMVEPATIKEDVVRREFTVNTLLWRLQDLADGPDKAEIIDLTGCGLHDLVEGNMKCPRDPDVVFSDDPSRMIRAVKFLLKYGFKIPPDVRASITRNLSKIKNIPPAHLSNMLVNTFLREPTGKKALEVMADLGILDVVKEIAVKDKHFRATLAQWADKEASLEFFFHLMDIGMPVGSRISFLSKDQQVRLREKTVRMSAEESDQFVAVLSQVGKVVDMPSLIAEFGLKGVEIRKIQDIARDLLLRDPSLAGQGAVLAQQIRALWVS